MFKNLSPRTRLVAVVVGAVTLVLVAVWLLVLAFSGGTVDPADQGRATTPAEKNNGEVVKEVPRSAMDLAQKAVLAWGNWDSFKYDGVCSGSWGKSDLAKAERVVELSKYVDASDLYGGDLTTANLATSDPMENEYGTCWRSVVQSYGDPVINSVKTVRYNADSTPTRVAVIGVPIKYAITTDIRQGSSGDNGSGGELPGTGNNFSGTAIVMAEVTLDPVVHNYYPATDKDASGLLVAQSLSNKQMTVVKLPTPTIDLTVVPSDVKLDND